MTRPPGPLPADSPPWRQDPDNIGSIAFMKKSSPDIAHTSSSFRIAKSAFLSADERDSNSVSIHNMKVSMAVISELGH